MFFPRGDSANAQQIVDAKAACNTCPVLTECRAHVLALPHAEVGVWGGMTEMERRMERAKRRRA
jgi:WhiB family redox-sensing transcriptional regulator